MNDKKFQLLVFDWDGTLADSEACILGAMHLAVADAGLPECSNTQIRNIIGLSLDGAIESLFPQIETKKRNSIAYSYREYYFSTSTSAVPVFEGVVETLEMLNQKKLFSCCRNREKQKGIRPITGRNGTG